MTIKPFAIQGADLTLGGVNLQAGTTGVVIPGVTRAANYIPEEVEDTVDQTVTWGRLAPIVIDYTRFSILNGDYTPAGSYEAATYFVDALDDEGYIDGGIDITNPGANWDSVAANGAQNNDMKAATQFKVILDLNESGQTGTILGGGMYSFPVWLHSFNMVGWKVYINDVDTGETIVTQDNTYSGGNTTGLVFSDNINATADAWAFSPAGYPFGGVDYPWNAGDWEPIPFRVKIRAGEVETIGGGNTGDVTFSDNVVSGSDGGWELGLSPSPEFTDGSYSAGEGDPDLGPQYFRVRGGDVWEHLHFDTTDNSKFDLYVGDDSKYFKLSKDGPAVIGTEDPNGPYDRHSWTFGTDGTLTFPDGTKQTSSLEPELTKVEGTIVANANIQFGDNSNGTIAVVDSQGDYDQWFNYTVGDTDGVMYACGENDDGPQYVWAFNTDGSVKWKVGIDDIDNNNVIPRTLSVRGDFLVVSATYNDVVTDEREIAVITLNKADGTVDESYTLSTNNIGSKRVMVYV
jgi:hypothetical protein